MSALSSILLALLIFVQGAGALAEAPIVSDPHNYFSQKIHNTVDNADSISPDAVSYAASYPIIDIGPWINTASSTDEERLEVVQNVLLQAISAGSFNMIGHNVSVDLLDRLESSTEKFFSQSIDAKSQFSSAGNAFAGYTPNQQEKYGSMIYKTLNPYEREGDLREIYGVVYPPDFPDNVQGPEYFQSVLNEYVEQLQPVELALLKIFSAALSLAKGVDLPLTYLYEADDRAPGCLRAHRYPAMPKEYNEATRFLPHSDFGSLTILYGTEKGLEEIRSGKWVEVPIDKGELHVTVGQVLNMWSNGLFADNIHRVSKGAAKDRVSFAYFLAQCPQSAPGGEGIAPVLDAQTEQAKFPRTSTPIHIGKYVAAMIEEKVVI